jgi:hypothetical protein
MPLCSYYAVGRCNRENCPYSHVKFNKNAEFCIEFAKGFCPLGFKVNFEIVFFYYNEIIVLVRHVLLLVFLI